MKLFSALFAAFLLFSISSDSYAVDPYLGECEIRPQDDMFYKRVVGCTTFDYYSIFPMATMEITINDHNGNPCPGVALLLQHSYNC